MASKPKKVFLFLKIKKLISNLKIYNILDIGCGTGEYSNLFFNKEYLGIDLDKKRIEVANKNFSNSLTKFENINLKDLKNNIKFSLILCLQTVGFNTNFNKDYPDLNNFFDLIELKLSENGYFIFNIPQEYHYQVNNILKEKYFIKIIDYPNISSKFPHFISTIIAYFILIFKKIPSRKKNYLYLIKKKLHNL